MLIEKFNIIARLAIISLLALLIIGLNPESASASYYAQTAWPALHRDSRNSDSVPFAGVAALMLAWKAEELLVDRPVLTAVTIGPREGFSVKLYVTAKGNNDDYHLNVYDRFGTWLWGKSLDSTVYFSSATVDVDGDIYIGDKNFLYAFHSDGRDKWPPVLSDQVYSSAITPDGYLVVVTQDGLVKVHNRLNGLVVQELDLGVYYTQYIHPVTNTPAVNPGFNPDGSSRIYIVTGTAPGTPDEGRFFGIDFDAASESLDIAFEKTIGVKSQTSPAISPVLGPADYVHVYAADNNPGDPPEPENYLYAFDADDGHLVWQVPLPQYGYNCPGTPSVGRAGLDGKTPIYFLSGGKVVAIKDIGEDYEENWVKDEQYFLSQSWAPSDSGVAMAGSNVSVTTNYLYVAVTFGNYQEDGEGVEVFISEHTFVCTLDPDTGDVVGLPVEVDGVCWGSLTVSLRRIYVSHARSIKGDTGFTALKPVSSLALAQSRIQAGKESGEEALSQMTTEKLDNATYLMSGALNQLEVVYAPLEDAEQYGEIAPATADNVLEQVNEALKLLENARKLIDDGKSVPADNIKNASKEVNEAIGMLNAALTLLP